MKIVAYVSLVLAASGVGSTAMAQEEGAASEMPGAVVREFILVPKEGMREELEEGIREHISWRAEKGDPLTWSVFMESVGNHFGTYYIRSDGQHYKDLGQMDEFDARIGGGAHYDEHVAPYVASFSALIDEVNMEASNWPEDSDAYGMIELHLYDLLPGRRDEYHAAVKEIHAAAKAQEWGVYYATGWNVIGGEPWDAWVALPHKTYETLGGSGTSMSQMLEAEYKKRKGDAVMDAYDESIGKTRSALLVWRKDLSTPD